MLKNVKILKSIRSIIVNIKKQEHLKWFIIIFTIKLFLLLFFSSDYLNKLFIPFVQHFLANFDNPWNYFYAHPSGVEFPYNPLMLYIVSFFYFPVWATGANSLLLQNFFFKLPTLLADILITVLLIKTYPNKIKEILIFYVASPIILYAVYMHSQLDLLPTAILFASIYFLRKHNIPLSALFFGLAMSIKFHVIAAFPIVAIYILKNFSIKKVIKLSAITFATYIFFIAPYIFSKGYYYLVLTHPKQMMLFDVFANFGPLKIYLPLLALTIIYGRFSTYTKINFDLLDAFLGIVFSLFILLSIPSPGWYTWMLPFLSLLFIKHYRQQPLILYPYIALNVMYIIFFLFTYSSHQLFDLIFLSQPISFKINNIKITNIVFTLLEATLLLIIYSLYKFGVRSNAIYKKTHPLIIGISGNSGTGKTTFMSDLKTCLGKKATILEGDGDHRWERGNKHWSKLTHLDPKANYLHRQSENILGLKMGNPIYRVDYNHATGKFDQPKKIAPNDFIILAGLHPFYLPKMRQLIDLKVFIDPSATLQLHWKIIRDTKKRGYSKEKIYEQIRKRKNDKTKHIDPQKEFADLIIHYFTDDIFEIGDPKYTPKIKLKVTLDSSIKLEPLIDELTNENIELVWDYANNLRTQSLTITQIPTQTTLEKIAKSILVNIEEITAPHMTWSDGHRGLVQLIVLLILSEKKKENSLTWQKTEVSYSTSTTLSTTTKEHTLQL